LIIVHVPVLLSVTKPAVSAPAVAVSECVQLPLAAFHVEVNTWQLTLVLMVLPFVIVKLELV
jgi:hypothetical protein